MKTTKNDSQEILTNNNYTLKIRLNARENQRLNQLAELAHSSKAAVLKQSLYGENAESVIKQRLIQSSFIKISKALDRNNLNEVREEMMNLCLSLNSVNKTVDPMK